MITSAEEFVRLRKSQIRDEYLAAAHSEAPLQVWMDVIERYPDMRAWVAHNKKIPEEIIRILAADKDHCVRGTIATKRRTPPDVLEVLAFDTHESVRASVAFNKKTPETVLRKMLNDEWEHVVETVKKRLGL